MTNTVTSIGSNIVCSIALDGADQREVRVAGLVEKDAMISLAQFDRIDALDAALRAVSTGTARAAQWIVASAALEFAAKVAERLQVPGRAEAFRAVADRIGSASIAEVAPATA